MTQTTLASIVGFANSTSISEIEKGKVRIQFDVLLSIAQFLACPISTLLPDYMHTEEITEPCELEYPERFTVKAHAILHDAFMEAVHLMHQTKQECGMNGKYWEIRNAAQKVLEAMDDVENAAFEWRQYNNYDAWTSQESEEVSHEQRMGQDAHSSHV